MDTNDKGNGGSAHLSVPAILQNAREQLESRTHTRIQLPVTTGEASNVHQNYSKGEAALDVFLSASADKSRAVTTSTATGKTNTTATMADFTKRVRLHPNPDFDDISREDTRRARRREMKYKKSLSDIREVDEEYEHDEDAGMNPLEEMREDDHLSEARDGDTGVIVRLPPGIANPSESSTGMIEQPSSSRNCVSSALLQMDNNNDEDNTPSRVTSPWSDSSPSESRNISPISFGGRSRSSSSVAAEVGDEDRLWTEEEDTDWAATLAEAIEGDEDNRLWREEADASWAATLPEFIVSEEEDIGIDEEDMDADPSVEICVALPPCEGQDEGDVVVTPPALEIASMSLSQSTMRAPPGLAIVRSEMGLPQASGSSSNQVPGTTTPMQAPPGLGRIALGFPVGPGVGNNRNAQVQGTGPRTQPPPGLREITTASPTSFIASNNQQPRFPDTRLALVRASHGLRQQTIRPPPGFENVIQVNDAVPWFIRRLVTKRNLPIDKILLGSQETVVNETWYVDYYRDVVSADNTATFIHKLENEKVQHVPQRSPWRGKTSKAAHGEYVEEMRRRGRPVVLRWSEGVGLRVEEEEKQEFVTLACEGSPSGVWDVPILALKASIHNHLRQYDSDLFPITSKPARAWEHNTFYDVVLLNWRPFANKNGGVYQPPPEIRIDTPEKWHEILEACGDEHRGWFERVWRQWAPKVGERGFVGCERCLRGERKGKEIVGDVRRASPPLKQLEYRIKTPEESEWMARNPLPNPDPLPTSTSTEIPITRSETTTSIPAIAPVSWGKRPQPQSPPSFLNSTSNQIYTRSNTAMSDPDPFGMTMESGVEDQDSLPVVTPRWKYEAMIAQQSRGGESSAVGARRNLDGEASAIGTRQNIGEEASAIGAQRNMGDHMGAQRNMGDSIRVRGEDVRGERGDGDGDGVGVSAAKWHDGSEMDERVEGGNARGGFGVIGEKRKRSEFYRLVDGFKRRREEGGGE